MIAKPYFKPAVTLVNQLKQGKMSSLELLEVYLDRVERFNPSLNAICWLDKEGARQQARRADELLSRGGKPGPLHGLPMTLKEAHDIEGVITTNGDPALRSNVAHVRTR